MIETRRQHGPAGSGSHAKGYEPRQDRRGLWTSLVLVPVVALWLFTAWISRDDRLRAILVTHALFALGLLSTYLAAWTVAAIWTRGRRRLVVFRAILTTVVLLVLLVLIDVPAYLGMIDYGSHWERVTGAWRGPARSFVADPELGFRRPPNLRMSGRPRGDIAAAWNIAIDASRDMEFTYNSKGFRSLVEYESADIVMLGDSHVEGWYVSDGETVSDRLAELTGLTVANLGQVGYGPGQELRLLELQGLDLSPETVVWFFYEGNDLYDDLNYASTVEFYRGGGDAGLRRGRGLPFRKTSFTVNAVTSLRRLLHPLIPNGMPYTGWFRDASGRRHRVYFHGECMYGIGKYEEGLFERNKAALRAGLSLAERDGFDLLVAYIPTKFRVYVDHCEFDEESPCRMWTPWDLPARFAAFCDEEGLACLDLTPAMRAAAGEGRLLHDPGESHWNKDAHGLVARIVAERLRGGERESERAN